MLNLSYENEFNLHVKEISFSYERMSTKTRFEEEAKGNSEMPIQRVIVLVFSNRPRASRSSHFEFTKNIESLGVFKRKINDIL